MNISTKQVPRRAVCAPALDVVREHNPGRIGAPEPQDLNDLRCAVIAHDDRAAQRVLAKIIEAHGGETFGAMKPYKAERAHDFRLEGDFVTYRIERHPGLGNWLLHRTETRRVDLITGEDHRLDFDLPRLTTEDLASFATITKERRRARAFDYEHAASDAVAYANEVAKNGDYSPRDVAIGWVAIIAMSHTLTKTFEGRARHLIEAHRAIGDDLFDVSGAKEIIEIAATLWINLPRITSRRMSDRYSAIAEE